MLDLYDSRPRRKTQKLRVWIDATAALAVLGFLVMAMAFPGALPSALRLGDAGPADAAQSGTRAWAYGEPEPASRAWASALEPSLVVACQSTLAQMRAPKFLQANLAQWIDSRWRQPTADELADAVSSLGSDQQFLGSCLRWNYGSIASCRHLGKFSGPEAEACLQPPVQRALAVDPWKLCAAAARLPQVKTACGAVAQAMERRAYRPAAGL